MSSFVDGLTKDRSLENNLDLLQSVGLLRFLRSNDTIFQDTTLYQWMTAARVGNELYQRVSGRRKIEEYRMEFLVNLVTYLKKNPNASEKSQKTEIERLLGIFILQLKGM